MNNNKEVVLKFCILCGQSVKPYHYSQSVYNDICDYGNSIYSPDYKLNSDVITYYCSCSNEEILAPNTFNTGCFCPVCGHFMPVFVNFCGVCGNKLI